MFMVKKKPHHRRRVRYPARFSATLGYVLLTASWLLVIGIAGAIVIENIAATLPQSQSQDSVLWIHPLGSGYATGGTTAASEHAMLGWRILLGSLLVLLAALSAHFVAVHMSRFVRRLLSMLGLKLTVGHLFVMKCLLALLAPLVMLVVVLALPLYAEALGVLLVGVCAAFSAVSVASFSVQHVLARHSRMPVKNIL